MATAQFGSYTITIGQGLSSAVFNPTASLGISKSSTPLGPPNPFTATPSISQLTPVQPQQPQQQATDILGGIKGFVSDIINQAVDTVKQNATSAANTVHDFLDQGFAIVDNTLKDIQQKGSDLMSFVSTGLTDLTKDISGKITGGVDTLKGYVDNVSKTIEPYIDTATQSINTSIDNTKALITDTASTLSKNIGDKLATVEQQAGQWVSDGMAALQQQARFINDLLLGLPAALSDALDAVFNPSLETLTEHLVNLAKAQIAAAPRIKALTAGS